MKNIKKIVGLFMLSAMMIVMPYKITSASVETNMKRVEEKANTVEISVDKINYEVKSFSLSLKIDGDVTLDSLTWSDTLSDKSVVKNYKYDTSSKNLVEYGNLKVASIKVKGEMNANYNINGKGKFKFIYSDKNKNGEMDSLPSNNNEEFKFIKASNGQDNDNNLGQDGEKPENDSNSGQDGEKPGTDNNLGQDEENPDNDNSQDKDENSNDSNEEPNESLENNDSNNKEDASSNEVETSDNLLKNIFIVLIVLSGGVILIYNFKKRKA